MILIEIIPALLCVVFCVTMFILARVECGRIMKRTRKVLDKLFSDHNALVKELYAALSARLDAIKGGKQMSTDTTWICPQCGATYGEGDEVCWQCEGREPGPYAGTAVR